MYLFPIVSLLDDKSTDKIVLESQKFKNLKTYKTIGMKIYEGQNIVGFNYIEFEI